MPKQSLNYDLYQIAADMLADFCEDMEIVPKGRSYGQDIYAPEDEDKLRRASLYLREMIGAAQALALTFSRQGLDQIDLHESFLERFSEMVSLSLEEDFRAN
ncbi:MAG: hypothetical protein LBJ14_07010 [Desulfarculales bacterium]|jgi:hypothetical protein|nr:hypothetical protein [Desulfarculales bacterium]